MTHMLMVTTETIEEVRSAYCRRPSHHHPHNMRKKPPCLSSFVNALSIGSVRYAGMKSMDPRRNICK
jgi:hypothetical protein